LACRLDDQVQLVGAVGSLPPTPRFLVTCQKFQLCSLYHFLVLY
jgi:hypothetical protein